MPQVDPELDAALRRLRAAFGPIEVLAVIDHHDDQATVEDGIEDGINDHEGGGEPPASPEP